MDACASPNNSKKQKLFEEEQCDGDNKDIISNLPESILHYILSFLPTKYAVATCVLSKRWKLLWTSIHNLDFSDDHLFSTSSKSVNYRKRKRLFIEFVDKVLRCNDFANIHKFSLICGDCKSAHFDEWISAIIRRNVQELSIFACPLGFPYCLSIFESLRILILHMSVSINITSSVCFSNLKVLHLKSIAFCGDQSMPEVSLTCPILQESSLDHCTWMKIKTFNIYAPTLPSLKIQGGMVNGSNDCVIKIYAENLISLKLNGWLCYEYSLCHLSSLVDVSMDLYDVSSNTNHLGSILKGIHNAKNLKLRANSISALSHPDVLAHFLSLPRLTHLKLLPGTGTNGRKFIDLLCNMPYIESLSFPRGTRSWGWQGHGRLIGTTPQCFLSHLQLVEIQNFCWYSDELWFIKFLIKSARVVHKLIIRVRSRELPEKESKQLQMLARNSNCIVELKHIEGRCPPSRCQ